MKTWLVLILVIFLMWFGVTKYEYRYYNPKIDIIKTREYERGFSDGKYYCEFMNARQTNSSCGK